ncbi:unnamed protein product [Closterium sp. NIES-53]
MYLMTCTRPDLAYPLSILARYVAPGRHRPEHMAAAKRVLRYLCSTSGMGLVLGGRRPVVLTGHANASWADDQVTQQSSQGYTFSLGSGSVSWRSTRSSSVLSSSCEAEIYAGAMAAQELHWLTYLLTDLGEQPRSPPVLYVDNKAMLALCREHRLEHRTKHIALRYFLARELQQRGQLRLAYVASEASTADIFTKALAPGDHQRFCTLLGFPTCTQHSVSSSISCFFTAATAATTTATATAATAATTTAATAATTTAATAAPACCATMASLRVLAFDHEGSPVQFDTWLDDMQLYLVSDSMDSVLPFDLASGTAPASPATADSATRSQWLTRDTAARLAIRNHLPLAECAHFGQHMTAQALYVDVVTRYSSPATAALGRLLLPYLFPGLSAFATIEDLVSHLRTSDARYRATVPAEFLVRNQPPMCITLYFIVTRLPDSLRSVRDHFLSLDPTSLTIDLLEQHLIAAETSADAVGAARGTPRPPFFEGCSPSPLAPSYASTAAADVPCAEDVGAASASAKRHSGKGKGSRGGGGGSGSGGGGSSGGSGGSGGGGSGGSGGGRGGVDGGGGGSGGFGGRGCSGTGGGRKGAQRGGSGGGQRQQQQRRSETQSPQQLREWLFQRGTCGGSVSCPYVIRTGDRAGQTCGRLHTQHQCFSSLDDAWRADFGDDVELPCWADLLRSGVAIFDLDFDVILSVMYALSVSAEGDCYRCVPPDPCIAAAALGASEFGTLLGTAPAEALHTFTLDSGASRCFFRDSTTLTPLPALVPVRLADPSGGPVVARSSTVLPCPAVPPDSPSGLHLPSFSTNLVSTAALQDAMVTTTTPGESSVAPLPGSSLLATPSCHAHSFSYLWSTQVSASPAALACPTLPSLHAPHSSSFPRTNAPLQTLHMDVWGPARVSGQGREHYFLLVVDDYTRYTTDFRAARDLPVLRLHCDRGGEFSSNLLQDFCRGEGIQQSFTLPDSPQQNGIAERRIGLVMEVDPQPLAPYLLAGDLAHTAWTEEVGDASVFRVWGSRAFVRDMSADKLFAHAIPCVFLCFVPDAPGWQFYHPTSRRVFPSQDVTFDKSVPFYRLFPYCSIPPPPPPLFLAPDPPPVDPLPPQGPAPSRVSHVDPFSGPAPVEVAVGSSASRGAASGGAVSGVQSPGGAESEGAGSGGAEPAGVERGGSEPEGVEPGGAESEGAESGGAEPRGAALFGGPTGALPRLSPQQLREWLFRHARLWSGATGDWCAGDARAGGAGFPAGAGGTGGTAATGPGGARTKGAGAAETGGVQGAGVGDPTEPGAVGIGGVEAGGAGVGGTGAGGAVAAGAGAVDPGAEDTVQLRLYFFPLLHQSSGLTERREPATHLVLLVRTARRAPSSRPPPVPGTPTVSRLLNTAVTDPSFESTAASALVAELLDFAATCHLDYATALVAESASVSPPSVGVESALGTDVLEDREEDFECLAAAVPRFASMLLAPEGDPDAPDIPTPCSYAEAITVSDRGFYYFQTFSPTPKMTTLRVLLHVGAQRDYELHSLDFSKAFLQGSLHEETWLRRPPGFTGSFPVGTKWSHWRPVHGLRQAPHEWHDTLRTTLAALGFAPSTVDPLLFLRTDTSLPPFYVLVYVDDPVFATADIEALTLVKSELQKRHTYTELGEVLQRFGFQFSSPQPTPLSTSQSLSAPPSDESVEPSGPHPELVGCLITSGMGLVLGGRGPVVLTGHADTPWVDDSATQRSSQGYTFSLGSGSISWRSTRSSSVLSSSCEAEIYAGAMAAQELSALTYLLTDLGEQPRSPPDLYVDNKAMIALCQEHRLEHRTKHIALRYFLAQELQQRGQLCLVYVASRANIADIFTKALPPGDHQRFSTVLALLALLFLTGLVTTCSPPLCLWECVRMGVSCGLLAHLHGHLEMLLAGGAAGVQELSRATGCWSLGMALHPVNVLDADGGRQILDVVLHLPHRQGPAAQLQPHEEDDDGTWHADEANTKGGHGRSTSRRPRRDAEPRKEKRTSKKTSSTKDVDNSSGKSRGEGKASCSMVGVVEPTLSLASEAGDDLQAVAAAMQANSMAVLLDSGCSHHPMGTKAVFVDIAPSDDVKHVRGFNGALQPIEGRGTVALQGEAGRRVLISDVLYVPSVQANLLSTSHLKESGVQLQGDGDEMMLVAATGELHARLAHVCVDTIKSLAKHEVATGLNIKPSTGADPPCVSCVGGKLAKHTFPDKGSDAEEALAVVHIDLCGPFRVAAKDGSLHFLLLKDRHTRFVWVMPVAKKSNVLREFQKWLVLVEWQAKKSVLMLRSDRGGEFVGKEFTDFVDGKGIVHDLTCPYTPQQNGMAEREMCTAVESVRTMLLHMGVQHHCWHLALRQAVWVRNCLERSTTPPGKTPYQLLTGKKPDLTLARVWGCMVQFMVPEQQRGGKLLLKACWGLHLGVLPESKGWEVLDLTNNKVVTSVEVIFYEMLSLEVWKAKHGPASGRTQAHLPTDTSTAKVLLLAEVDEPADEDVVEVLPPSPFLAPPFPIADRLASTLVLAITDEGSLEASPVAPAIDRGAADGAVDRGVVEDSKQLVDDLAIDEEGELSAGEESTDCDVVEVSITKPELRHTGRAQRPPERLSFHACLPPAAFTTVYDEVDDDLLYDDAEEDEELPELDPDVHADPEHRWDITTMTVKEAMASWKGEAVEAAMEEGLIGMGTWELVERPRGVNIMKNWWVLTTKYCIDDTVERKKARLVVKGFTQVCGADYDETYSPVTSYVTLRIFLSIVTVLDLKNAFLQSKLDMVLYMYQPDYFDDRPGV